MPELSGSQTTRSGNPFFCYGTGRNPTAKYHPRQSATSRDANKERTGT